MRRELYIAEPFDKRGRKVSRQGNKGDEIMAEIPVTKKDSNSWIWWLLLALGVLALIWFLLSDDDDDIVEPIDNDVVATAPVTPVMAADTMVIGESVNLEGVRVTSLAGDMAFMVDANGQEMLVLFDQTPTPGDATEGEYDINPGSMVNLSGTVRDANQALPDGVTATIPAGTQKYIYATDIEMVS